MGPKPCETCLANESEGWIPLEDSFSSGDLIPVSHPGCYCSIDLKAGAGAKAA